MQRHVARLVLSAGFINTPVWMMMCMFAHARLSQRHTGACRVAPAFGQRTWAYCKNAKRINVQVISSAMPVGGDRRAGRPSVLRRAAWTGQGKMGLKSGWAQRKGARMPGAEARQRADNALSLCGTSMHDAHQMQGLCACRYYSKRPGCDGPSAHMHTCMCVCVCVHGMARGPPLSHGCVDGRPEHLHGHVT